MLILQYHCQLVMCSAPGCGLLTLLSADASLCSWITSSNAHSRVLAAVMQPDLSRQKYSEADRERLGPLAEWFGVDAWPSLRVLNISAAQVEGLVLPGKHIAVASWLLLAASVFCFHCACWSLQHCSKSCNVMASHAVPAVSR